MNRLSPSLLDSFAYYNACQDEEKSLLLRSEILDSLRGKPRQPNEAMQKGLDFEANVVLACNNKYNNSGNVAYDCCVREIATEVKGSRYQIHVARDMDGTLLHGFIDFLRADQIYDVKTCGHYDVGKYLRRSQHLIYLYCMAEMNVWKFSYLVTDFQRVYREDYAWHDNMYDELRSRIRDWYDYLCNDTEMRQAFEARDSGETTDDILWSLD